MTAQGAQEIVDPLLNTFGHIDIVVKNAGVLDFDHLLDITLEYLHRWLSIHPRLFQVTREAWPHLLRRTMSAS